MILVKQRYTTEEFERFTAAPENRNRLFELLHGKVSEKMPTDEHGIIAGLIFMFLWQFARPRGLGLAGVEVRHQMPHDRYNSRLPDVSFRRDTQVIKQGAVPQMPDLAVEICSPDDTAQELQEKAEYYLQNGSVLVWLVYPLSRTVEVCTLTEDGNMQIETMDIKGTLAGGDVLPDFTLDVKEIFNY